MFLVVACPVFAAPRPPPAVPAAEPDWRGLEEAPGRKKPAPSPVTALVQNAPYRAEVATSDTGKVLLTNAFTLERRRVWEAPTAIAALAFSPDGSWLYAATRAGEIVAVDPDKATVRPLARVALTAGEQVVALQGAGGLDMPAVSVRIGAPDPPPFEACPTWHALRSVVVRRSTAGTAPARTDNADGWGDGSAAWHGGAVSPNTKLRVEVSAGNLEARGRFGAPSVRINKAPLPGVVLGITWMRDSRGVVLGHARGLAGRCRSGVGVHAYRNSGAADGSWAEWALPADIDVTQPGWARTALEWAPDGMRWLGVGPRGVLLIEPAPRHRGVVNWIAPPSTAWPAIRPGVRPLVTAGSGATLHAELLIEQGDLDAAAGVLAAGQGGPDVGRLHQRVLHLRDVAARRAREAEGRTESADAVSPLAAPALPAGATPAVQ